MDTASSMRNTWEKILEYASSPVHGTMSRQLRTGVSLQIDRDQVYSQAQMFIGETFVRLTMKQDNGTALNAYYDLAKIKSITTISAMK